MDKKQFCEKLSEKYRQIKALKADAEKITTQMLEGDLDSEDHTPFREKFGETREKCMDFYRLFSEKAIDDVFELTKDLETLKKTDVLAKMIPIFSLTLDNDHLEAFVKKMNKSENVDHDYLNVILTSLRQDDDLLKESLNRHADKYFHYDRSSYPFDLFRMMNISARNKDLFSDKERELLETFLKNKSLPIAFGEDKDDGTVILPALEQEMLRRIKGSKRFYRINALITVARQVLNPLLEKEVLTDRLDEVSAKIKFLKKKSERRDGLDDSEEKYNELLVHQIKLLRSLGSYMIKTIANISSDNDKNDFKMLNRFSKFFEAVADIKKMNLTQIFHIAQNEEENRLSGDEINRVELELFCFFCFFDYGNGRRDFIRDLEFNRGRANFGNAYFKIYPDFLGYLYEPNSANPADLFNLEKIDFESTINMAMFGKFKILEIGERLKNQKK